MKRYYPVINVSRAANSVKNWQNLPISNPKPDFHNINAHTKFGDNQLTPSYHSKKKLQMDRQTDDQHDTLIPYHYSGIKGTIIS